MKSSFQYVATDHHGEHIWYVGFFSPVFFAGGCNSNKVSSLNVPAHHTPSGFQNNHLPPE